MSTSSIKTPTQLEREVYQCPDWCERWDHDVDVIDADHPIWHYGPDFGLVGVQAAAGDSLAGYFGDLDDERFDAAALRKLAADCLAAAEWLEAHQ